MRRWYLWLLAVVFLLEGLLIIGYYHREVGPFPPGYFDQAGYLTSVYQVTDGVLRSGWRPLFQFIASGAAPQGILLYAYGVIAETFHIGRFAPLTLNIAAFLILQVAIFYSVRHVSRSVTAGLAAVGLLLSLKSIWLPYGGLFDYRPDFFALCAYGVWVCAVLRSDLFQDRRWSIVAGCVAAVLCLDRYVASIYVLGVTLGIVLLIVLLDRSTAKRRLLNAAIATGIMVAVVAPFLIVSVRAIWAYYGVGHLTGEEKYIRAAAEGISSQFGHLIYYPKSLIKSHLGGAAIAVAVAFSVAAFVLSFRGRLGRPMVLETIFLIGAVAGPLIVLTADVSKSPVVGGVVVVPMVLLLVLLVTRVFLSGGDTPVRLAAGAAFLVLGFLCFWTRSVEGYLSIAPENQAWRDAVVHIHREAQQRQLTQPRVFFDSVSDRFNAGVLTTFGFEQNGVFVPFVPAFGATIFAVTRAQAWEALDRSDIVVLSGIRRNHPYPFFDSVIPFWNELRDRVAAEFIPTGSYRAGDGSAETLFYVRPTAQIFGTLGPWLAPTGTKVRVDTKDIRPGSVVRMRGNYPSTFLSTPPNVSAVVRGEKIPVHFSVTGDRYEIELDLSGKVIADQPQIEADLTFDRHFVPKEIGLNADERQLVLWTPTDISIVKRDR